MLILNRDEVKRCLSMRASLEAMEQAYLDLGRGRAVNRPRADSWVRTGRPSEAYLLKTMDGVVPGLATGAVRINSNHVAWKKYGDGLVKTSATGRYVGMVILFDLADGLPLALFPDEHIQAERVGATTGLAVKYLAPSPIRKAAVIGSGRQARSALEALFCLNDKVEAAIYSPNPDHRGALAQNFSQRGLPVKAVSSAEAAVDGADLIVLATSSLNRVCPAEWVRPGRLITCVKFAEVGEAVASVSEKVAVNAHEGSPVNFMPGMAAFAGHDPLKELGIQTVAAEASSEPDWSTYPELCAIMAGDCVRPGPDQSALFINNIGLGIQFAAVGRVVYSAAREMGLGLEVGW